MHMACLFYMISFNQRHAFRKKMLKKSHLCAMLEPPDVHGMLITYVYIQVQQGKAAPANLPVSPAPAAARASNEAGPA